MIRRAVAAVSLAIVAAWAGTPLVAGRDSNKATYACGTAFAKLKRVEGRLNTWNLSTFSFTPDSRSTRPLLIPYKSITRLEYGRTPPHWVETPDTSPVTLRCTPRSRDRYLTIFYKEVPPLVEDEKKEDKKKKYGREKDDEKKKEDEKKKDPPKPMDQWEKDKQARLERRERLDQKELKDLQEKREDEKTKKEKDDLLKEKEQFVVFELGDAVLRPTLKVLESRSGRRVTYEDAAARRAAR
jgi:hypothetical protein